MLYPLRIFNQGGQHFIIYCITECFWLRCWLILLHYYTRLQLELLMVLVSGYMECVKLHHIWKLKLHAVAYHLYTTLCSAISLIYHSTAL